VQHAATTLTTLTTLPTRSPRPADLDAAVIDPDATVIDLDAERAARRQATHRLHLRRRLAVLLAVLGLAVALALLVGAVGATADLQQPAVAGQVVLAPGETLWEVASRHAPAGVDARVYLQAIQDVNGFATADLPAWTTVMLPATAG